MENNIETSRALATRIYDLDSEVYRLVGSSLGRTFTGDKETSIRNLTTLISTHPQGHLLRSEIALIGNMARTIRNKEDRSRMMHEYNEILHQIAELPESFGSVDILDQNLASLNTSNLHQKFSKDDHLIVEMAKKEDFIVMGRCADVILTNNRIPHISIFITAPFEQRVRRMMEVNNLPLKEAVRRLKKIDKGHEQYYHFYTGRKWGDAVNYDLCINSACYGIEESVELIERMIDIHPEK